MSPHSSSPSTFRRGGRTTIVAIATAIGFLTFAAAGLAATGSVYVDGKFNVAAGHDFFGGAAPTNGSNVGVGYSVFPNLTTGEQNTAVGRAALRADITGFGNTASGYLALADNTVGFGNVATGEDALAANTAGFQNVASGDDAMEFNTDGGDNVATGERALVHNTTGGDNVATGEDALIANTTGASNLGSGFDVMFRNTTGNDNVAEGRKALFANTTGDHNVAIGDGAGHNLTTGSDDVDIANEGVAGESKAIRIGTSGTQKRTFLAGVSGTTLTGSAQPVLVKADGQLGTATSAVRPASEGAVARLKAQNRRENVEITTLKREVAKLSRR